MTDITTAANTVAIAVLNAPVGQAIPAAFRTAARILQEAYANEENIGDPVDFLNELADKFNPPQN